MKNPKAFFKFYFINSVKSPVFCIISVLFTILTAGNYYIRQQFFTGSGTTDLLLYFSIIPYLCIIFIPALCYRHSFSIYEEFIPLSRMHKLFLNFLVKLLQFAIMLLLIIPGALLVNLYGSIDAGQFIISLIMLLLYGASTIALCGFIEALMPNKISSLVVQALLMAIFNSAHLFAVYLPLPQFLAGLCKSLSFAWHFDGAGKGILDTRDLLWYSGITVLFILITDFINQSKQGRFYKTKQKFNFFCTLLLTILVILNGSRFYTRFDFSYNKTYSPSKYTKQLLNLAENPLKITYYRSSSISRLYPQVRDVSDFLNEYASLNKNVSYLIKDPDKDSQSKTLLENYGIQTQQLRSVTSTSTEYTNVYSAIIIEYNGNIETIPFTMSANTLEYDLDGRVKHLLTGTARTVNIIVGNGMNLTEDYSYVIPWLNSQGFICNPLYVNTSDFTDQLSKARGPLLVIGDSNILIEDSIAIEDYILQNKGNPLFMISPYSVNIAEDWQISKNLHTNIIEMVENWGVKFNSSIAADLSCARIQMYSDDNSASQILNYPLWPSLLQQTNAPLGLTMFWSTPLTLEADAVPYLLTTAASYSYEITKDKPLETNPFVVETMSSTDMEKSTNVLAAQITGPLKGLYNLESTDHSDIVVLSDQYFVNSLMTGYIGGEYGDYRNFDFLTQTLLKLNGEEDLARLQSRSTRDTSLFKINDSLQFERYRLITFIILFILIPLLQIITGVLLNVQKKNKY